MLHLEPESVHHRTLQEEIELTDPLVQYSKKGYPARMTSKLSVNEQDGEPYHLSNWIITLTRNIS